MREYEYAETIRKRATPDEFHPGLGKIGVYCKKCEKTLAGCLCRTHDWYAKREKIDD